jgi:hypothetical protein
MRRETINSLSGRAAVVLSITALLAVVSGYFQQPQRDEGSSAHIFQLSVALLLPTICVFLVTANWQQRWRSLRPMMISAATLAVAFVSLFCLEHYWYR